MEEPPPKPVYTPPHNRLAQSSQHQAVTGFNRATRLEFPKFSGDDPRSWMRRANRYFQNNPMDDLAKVNHAAYFMTGVADLWFYEYIEGKQHVH